ncbi:hypothetical protein AI2587V1_5157, partial (plasmid) [Klebsiella pneumoniae]
VEEYPIIDLSHLMPVAQGLARLPADERIHRLRADRWIGYPRAVEALNRLEALYAWPNKQRMPNLLLVGPTNNGKSMIVEKFRRRHCCKVSDEAAFCLIQRPYISKTLLTRRISPRGSP